MPASETSPNPSFYDDRVREELADLAGSGNIDRNENVEMLFGDSNLDEVLQHGNAYGESVDSLLREISRTVGQLDLYAGLSSNAQYRRCQAIAAEALSALKADHSAQL